MSLPAALLGRLDHWLRPGLRRQYGGPFNGQRARARLVAEIAALGAARAVVETGTFRGATAAFLVETFRRPVHSVEIDPRAHAYARLRVPGARLALGDSRRFLRDLAADPAFPATDVFFYLDAHRPGDDPLADELAEIRRGWREHLVMIDDVQVPGDPGYGFNAGLAPDRHGLAAFYPATPSREETGYRRGCVVLATPGAWSERMRGLPLLVSAP